MIVNILVYAILGEGELNATDESQNSKVLIYLDLWSYTIEPWIQNSSFFKLLLLISEMV